MVWKGLRQCRASSLPPWVQISLVRVNKPLIILTLYSYADFANPSAPGAAAELFKK